MCQQFGRIRLPGVREFRPTSDRPTLRLSCAMYWRTSCPCLLHIKSCASSQNFRCIAGLLPWREKACRSYRKIQGEATCLRYLYDHRVYHLGLHLSGSLLELRPIGTKLTFLATFDEHLLIFARTHQSEPVNSSGRLQKWDSYQFVLLRYCNGNRSMYVSLDDLYSEGLQGRFQLTDWD